MSVTEMLLAGPRGRRLLLEFAIASEQLTDPEYHEDSLSSAAFFASYDLDPDKGTSVQLMIGYPDAKFQAAQVTPHEVARRLSGVDLAEVTPDLLRHCLTETVDAARYWQEPDGEDVLAGIEHLRQPLRRVAEHIAASRHTQWWGEPVAEQDQWQIDWEGNPPHTLLIDPSAVLRDAREEAVAEEETARKERPSDPEADCSGTWWSRPPWELPSSTRALSDGSPAGLWFEEDGLGWESASTRRVGMPSNLRYFEIDSADAWAGLCREFPIEVTAQKRHDWYRTTGRNGRWVAPDWARVAEKYDAVHLQTLAYLSTAGNAIAVDDNTASVIAGWAPDHTYWFTPRVRYVDDPVKWVLREGPVHDAWVRAKA